MSSQRKVTKQVWGLGPKGAYRRCGFSAPQALEEMRFNHLLAELEQAREDHRASMNHISQILIAGIAGLAIVCSLAASSDSSYIVEGVTAQPIAITSQQINGGLADAFYVAVLFGIVVAAFSYLIGIGFERSFRYHYIRELEFRLSKLYPKQHEMGLEGSFASWEEASSPLVTHNARHVKFTAARIHFVAMVAGIVSVLVVCVGFGLIFVADDMRAVPFVAGASILIVAATLACFFYGTALSWEMYKDARRHAADKRERDRQKLEEILDIISPRASSKAAPNAGGSKNPTAGNDGEFTMSWPRMLLYLVYPRPGDALKLFFIVLGVALVFVLEGSPGLGSEFAETCIFSVVLFDVLLYQARYQVNDIRGIDEDQRNSQGRNRNRLAAIKGHSKTFSIMLSSAVVVLRIVLAIVLAVVGISMWGSWVAASSAAGFAGIFGLAVLYERFRGKSSGHWAELSKGKPHLTYLSDEWKPDEESKVRQMTNWTFILVCLGYPLRVFIGCMMAWAATGGTMDRFLELPPVLPIALAFILVATAFFGESFVTLTWALEASDLRRKIIGEQDDKEKEKRSFYKPHIALMGRLLGGAIEEEYPLKDGSPTVRRWNVSMWISAVVMAALLTVLHASDGAFFVDSAYAGWLLLAFLLLTFAALAIAASKQEAMGKLLLAYVISCGLLVGSFFLLGHQGAAQISIGVTETIAISLAAYMLIYLAFRCTNYEGMNNIKIAEIALNVADPLLRLIAGKEIYERHLKEVFGKPTDKNGQGS